MAEQITHVQLDAEYEGRLKAEAERRGMTPEDLAAELIQEELKKRTAPRATKGTVTPFRR